MSNPKMNNTRWHVQGLVVLMCILLPVLATGTAEARYRAEKTAEIQFQIWEPAQIYLGTLSGTTETEGEGTAATPEELTFHPDGELTWTESLGTYSMELAVANGSSETDFSEKDQQFRLQMIGSIGLGTETEFPLIELKVPSEENPETIETFQGKASKIEKGTLLYHSMGSGWIIRFQNAEGNEPLWTLKGGTLSYKGFTITVENAKRESDILLQPQVEAKVIMK